uniref:Uncharacterized protein n=1 Tax=Romanomermis culicivorax TaxID=13658 RepID=A0A915KJ11_ROMCU
MARRRHYMGMTAFKRLCVNLSDVPIPQTSRFTESPDSSKVPILEVKNESVRSADGSTTDYYQCWNCEKLATVHGQTIVKNNRLMKNAEASHSELCAPIGPATLDTSTLIRNMIKWLENGMLPIRTYRKGLAQILQCCIDPGFANQVQVQLALPAFQSVCHLFIDVFRTYWDINFYVMRIDYLKFLKTI